MSFELDAGAGFSSSFRHVGGIVGVGVCFQASRCSYFESDLRLACPETDTLFCYFGYLEQGSWPTQHSFIDYFDLEGSRKQGLISLLPVPTLSWLHRWCNLNSPEIPIPFDS